MTRSLVWFRICLLVAAMALLSTGCARVSRFVASADPYHSATYKGVYEKWTRQCRIHRGLEVVLIASATFKSEEFRKAYTEEYAKAHRLGPEEEERLLRDQVKAVPLGHDVIVAVFVPDKKWNDFDKADATWRLYLVNDWNERVAPVEVRRLKRGDPVLSHFFPYITPHKSAYAVRFPYNAPGGDQPFLRGAAHRATLIITSVLGTAEMHWDFDLN
ncbi:MAG: hypothetical protein SWE60_21900 [Thermodesulfobacteriota bacterium]|nr:hypothetical protein [Thermodesulfobacteriota bacterium]